LKTAVKAANCSGGDLLEDARNSLAIWRGQIEVASQSIDIHTMQALLFSLFITRSN